MLEEYRAKASALVTETLMYGPEPRGHWSGQRAPNHGSELGLLVAGRRYRVTAEFRDYDGDIHRIGEEWEFLGYSFLPYEDGVSLFVGTDGDLEWLVRMQRRPDQQEQVLDHLEEYFEAVGGRSADDEA